eukprot:GILI01011817.1.p1 GENE.GILI01011817.1~~GILI01011817.1.p1  ORF type:complete len:540 (-),score=177.39 GILI01011817.1:87-1655(-)
MSATVRLVEPRNDRANFPPLTVKDDTTPIIPTLHRLRNYFKTDKTKDLTWRKAQLKNLIRGLQEMETEILEALNADLAKAPLYAFVSEISGTISEAKFALAHLDKWAKPEHVDTPLFIGPGKSYIVSEPYGVALIIGTWNFPLYCSLVPLVSAIAAGNCVFLKPSELAAYSSRVMFRLLTKYMDPEGVVCVEGGVEVAKAILREKFDYIFFTGSTEKGKLIAAAAAQHLTPYTLELGGKSPTYIHSDADIENAVLRIASSKFTNHGQTCVAPDYILCHESVQEELVKRMSAAMVRFFSEEPQSSPDLGRVISEGHTKRLITMLETHGGQVVHGGKHDLADRYIEPTLILNPSPSSKLMSEEIFGPILPILTVRSVQEAIDFIRERPKPLALYIFSGSDRVKQDILRSTSSGGVGINECLFHILNPYMPFGGVGDSGVSSYHGKFGFEAFSHKRSVLDKLCLNGGPFAMRFPPFDADKEKKMRKSIGIMHVTQSGALKALLLFLLVVVVAAVLGSQWRALAGK